MSKYRMRAAALLAAGAVAGGATAATLSAQAADETGSASASADSGGSGEGRGPGGHGRGGERYDSAALAKALGVSEDKLATALDAARDATAPDRDEKPAEGEERTAPTDEERAEREAAFAKALAEELGVDEDKVSDALETVRSAAKAERRTALGERLDQAVEDGELTAADKASVLKAYDAGVIRSH